MNCSRCQGLMVLDHFLDFWGSYRELWSTGWRCINCGQIHDPLSAKNRLAQQKKLAMSSRQVPDYQDDDVYLGAEAITKHAA